MIHNFSKVNIPKKILYETLLFFQDYGSHYLEAFVIWAGNIENTCFEITKLIKPVQENSFINYYISADEVHRINLELNKLQLIPIAQLHTHPCDPYHSSTDDKYAVLNLPGCFSIVFPDYGFIEVNEIDQWAVYKLENNHWYNLKKSEVLNLFQIK